MNILNKYFHISPFLLLTTLLLFHNGFAMTNSYNKQLSQDEFNQLLQSKPKIPDFISNSLILSGLNFSAFPIEDITFSNCKIINIKGSGSTIRNTTFSDCEIIGGSLENSQFENVNFIDCKIINTIFNNSNMINVQFINSEITYNTGNPFKSFKGVISKPISFHKSKLNELNFYEAQGEFYFINSELNLVNIYAKNNSTILIDKSSLKTCDFSDSKLESLVITNTKAYDSKANEAKINKILLENNEFKSFPIADGENYGDVKIHNTSDIIIGGGPVNNVSITDCKGYDDISVAEMNFNNITIERCKVPAFVSFDAKGKKMTLTDMDIYKLWMEDSDIEHLILNNINIEGEIYINNAKIKNYEAHNVTVQDGVITEDKGANFNIKTTK